MDQIRVDCYAGYRGDEKPCRVYCGSLRLDIKTIRDQWITPETSCFKVVTGDDCAYLLEQEVSTGQWKIMPVPGIK